MEIRGSSEKKFAQELLAELPRRLKVNPNPFKLDSW